MGHLALYQPPFSEVQALRMIIAYLCLFIFGLGYNWLIGYLDRKGLLEGFDWLAVVVGVFVTLAALAVPTADLCLIGWEWFAVALVGFAASGSAMAAGALIRYLRARQAHQDALREAK